MLFYIPVPIACAVPTFSSKTEQWNQKQNIMKMVLLYVTTCLGQIMNQLHANLKAPSFVHTECAHLCFCPLLPFLNPFLTLSSLSHFPLHPLFPSFFRVLTLSFPLKPTKNCSTTRRSSSTTATSGRQR